MADERRDPSIKRHGLVAREADGFVAIHLDGQRGQLGCVRHDPIDTFTRRARWTRLQKPVVKALVYVVLAYLLFRLLPALKQAFRSLEHVRWQWILVAVALELLSEFGYVQSWRSIVDPDRLLAADGGARTATRAAWAQLAGGIVMPGGSLASIGVGAWILRRFGMPATTIAERQFNLSFTPRSTRWP